MSAPTVRCVRRADLVEPGFTWDLIRLNQWAAYRSAPLSGKVYLYVPRGKPEVYYGCGVRGWGPLVVVAGPVLLEAHHGPAGVVGPVVVDTPDPWVCSPHPSYDDGALLLVDDGVGPDRTSWSEYQVDYHAPDLPVELKFRLREAASGARDGKPVRLCRYPLTLGGPPRGNRRRDRGPTT